MSNCKILAFSLIGCWGLLGTSVQAVPPVTNGLYLWLTADSLVGYTNHQLVATWNDSSGNGHNGSNTGGGQAPWFLTNAVGGKSSLHFDGFNGDGTGDRFEFTHVFWSQTPGYGGGITYIAAFRSTSTRTTESASYNVPDTLIGDNDGNANFLNAFGLTNGYPVYTEYSPTTGAGWNSGPPVGTKFVSDNQAHIIDATDSSGAQNLYADGKSQGSSANAWYSIGPGFSRVGGGAASFGANGDFFSGDVAEILIYNRELSPSDRLWVDNYLADKYSIDGVPEPSGALLLALGGLLLCRKRSR
jgi:hypothetical protein